MARMAVFHHAYTVPLARAIHVRAVSVACSGIATVTAPSLNKKKEDPQVLLGMSEQDLQQLALDFGQQSYRGKQLHHLLYKRKVKEIQDFSHLPLAFRNELQDAGWRVGRSPIHKAVTAADGTVKLLVKLEDNRLVETVGIPVKDEKGSIRLTACVSSQVLAIEELFKHRVTNVVFMGMGEPMLNMKEVLEAHRCLNKDIQIGQRMITISTVGVPNTIKKLASCKLQSTLAISLHAPNQKLREKLVPSAKSYPLDAIMKDCRDYFHETSRRVSFEYTLLAGVNDEVGHAKELAELLHEWGPGYHVNLIPYNPVDGSEYKRPYKKSVLAFSTALESRKITVSVRQTRGLDASAACGQLRNEFQKTPLLSGAEDQQSQSELVVA
ncbi:uncharacterized protein LOC111397502 isoform X2 [Olea europaea var. sylvestris]|uniref:uncharacterized protein LOC111397502 isoform X2 n=1 Tax=Olea europaea var. sylvestris TaxID=158386 RepID=UPI000C1D5D49|nr:uncharacterized protein LOC111397502 isoform X2 [Olea europaea var. sylvestris]